MAMIYRICQYCSREYRTHHTTHLKYCSQECYGLSRRRGESMTCVQCGNDFYQQLSKSSQKYCSHSCATTARNLTEQNPAYHRDVSGSNNPMYGKGMAGENNPMYGKTKEHAPRWKGGRQTRLDGYVLVIAADNHPYPADIKRSGTKYILEHRHVMEQHLGRYLLPTEVVHHKDENPSNNHIENLELFSSQSAHVHIGHGAKSP